jgi:hypothetical protein
MQTSTGPFATDLRITGDLTFLPKEAQIGRENPMREFPDDVAEQLSALQTTKAPELRSLWRATFGRAHPSWVQREFLLCALAYHFHEAENLYLADEVLALVGHTWESAKAAIVAAAHNYGLKQSALASAGSWDRAKHELKNIINEVALILDTKRVPWAVRVGNAIGRARPSGQLAEFLGPTLLGALWPLSPSTTQQAEAATA